jgi:Bacterial extracellular solute-binding protein
MGAGDEGASPAGGVDGGIGFVVRVRRRNPRACRRQPEGCEASSKYKSIALPPELSVGPEYGLTVSRKAAAGAADFAMYLLSPQGQSSLKSFGFIPVTLPAAR